MAIIDLNFNYYSFTQLSEELRMDKELCLIVVKVLDRLLDYASDELKKDNELISKSIINNSNACAFSLLEGYQDFDEIVEKEGEEFLFSCWNNRISETRLQVANHPNFLPTLEQVNVILQDENEQEIIKEVYNLRQDEWIAKIEEKKLKTMVK